MRDDANGKRFAPQFPLFMLYVRGRDQDTGDVLIEHLCATNIEISGVRSVLIPFFSTEDHASFWAHKIMSPDSLSNTRIMRIPAAANAITLVDNLRRKDDSVLLAIDPPPDHGVIYHNPPVWRPSQCLEFLLAMEC